MRVGKIVGFYAPGASEDVRLATEWHCESCLGRPLLLEDRWWKEVKETLAEMVSPQTRLLIRVQWTRKS